MSGMTEAAHGPLPMAADRAKSRRERWGKRKIERSSWRQVATTRICRLRAMMAIENAQLDVGGAPDLEQAGKVLEKADQTLKYQHESFSTWWNGSLVDQVWREIHQAETIITSRLSDCELERRTAEILHDARLILDSDDPILKEASAAVKPYPDRDGADMSETDRRAIAGELVRRYREAWDDRYTRSRSFRNRLIVLIGIVVAAVVVLVTAGSLGMIWLTVPKHLPPHADWSPNLDDFLAMLAIAIVGAVGGLISGSGEVIKVGGVYNPFSLPWYLLFFKIPMGALTGILGAMPLSLS